jgi:hypothetical protein
MTFKLLVGIAGGAVLAAACGSKSADPGGTGATTAQSSSSQASSSASSGSGGSAPTCSGEADGALECKAPKACGDPVTMTNVPEALPMGAGGMVADGVYVLTAYNVYTGKGGESGPTTFKLEEVLVIEGGGKTARWRLGVQGPAKGFSGTLDTSKGFFTLTTACPGMSLGKDLPYTATPDKLTLYDTMNKDERILERRGP